MTLTRLPCPDCHHWSFACPNCEIGNVPIREVIDIFHFGSCDRCGQHQTEQCPKSAPTDEDTENPFL